MQETEHMPIQNTTNLKSEMWGCCQPLRYKNWGGDAGAAPADAQFLSFHG